MSGIFTSGEHRDTSRLSVWETSQDLGESVTLIRQWGCEEQLSSDTSTDLAISRPRAGTPKPETIGRPGGTFNIFEKDSERPGHGSNTTTALQLFLEATLERLPWQGTMPLSTTINFHLPPAAFPFRIKVIQRFGFLRNCVKMGLGLHQR